MSGGVTIREMENFATSLPDINIQQDLGNVIEINDFGGDDLGLLANAKLMSNGPGSQSQSQNNVINVSPPSYGGSSGGGISEVDITNIDPLQPIQLDGHGGFTMPSVNVQYASDPVFGNSQSSSGPSVTMTPAPPRDIEAETKEKTEYINKLARLEKKGFPVSRRYTLDNTLEEVKSEYFRLVDARNLETSVKFQRNMMMGFVTGLEWMNNKFDPLDLKLDGWSESVHENMEDYDDIFEELYDKYKERGKMPPEARLLFTMAGSGFMFHVSNSFFKSKMSATTPDDIFRQNPELARQFAAAAAAQAGPGFGKFMGSAMGMPPGQSQGYNPNIADPGPGPGAFFGSPMANVPMGTASAPPPPVRRREMKGPSGVDDILKTFEEVRQAQETPVSFNPPNPNPDQRPAVVAASEINSQEDMGSVETGKTGAGRRRRATRVPVESTLTLNV
jgi:hypothetical protein